MPKLVSMYFFGQFYFLTTFSLLHFLTRRNLEGRRYGVKTFLYHRKRERLEKSSKKWQKKKWKSFTFNAVPWEAIFTFQQLFGFLERTKQKTLFFTRSYFYRYMRLVQLVNCHDVRFQKCSFEGWIIDQCLTWTLIWRTFYIKHLTEEPAFTAAETLIHPIMIASQFHYLWNTSKDHHQLLTIC